MTKQQDNRSRLISSTAALAVLFVLVVVLAFGGGLALGRLWGGRYGSPPSAPPAAEAETDSP